MPKENQVLLKPAVIGGFDKKAVLSYIFDLNESAHDVQQKLTEQIEELTASRENLMQGMREMESRLSAAQAEAARANDHVQNQSAVSEESQGIIDRLNAELARQAKIIAQKNEEVSNYASKCAELETQNNQLKQQSAELEQKRSHVEQAASKISELVEQSKSDGAKIIERAKNEAVEITRAAHNQAGSIIEQAKAHAEDHIKSFSKNHLDAYSKFDSFCDEIANLKKSVLDATFAMSSKMEEIHGTVQQARNAVPEAATNLSQANTVSKRETGIAESPSADASKRADDILSQYGIRKDDSGFFRLSADK